MKSNFHQPHLHLLAQRRTAGRGSNDIRRPSSSVVTVDVSLVVHRLLIRGRVMRATVATLASALAALQIRQTPGLGVDIPYLPIALRVEGCKLLTRGRVDGFFKVRVDAAPAHGGLVGDAVIGIEALGAVAGFVLAVELGERVGEAR